MNRPETFAAMVEKVHSYGIMVFSLFMFGFDGTAGQCSGSGAVQYRGQPRCLPLPVLAPYPGTLT